MLGTSLVPGMGWQGGKGGGCCGEGGRHRISEPHAKRHNGGTVEMEPWGPPSPSGGLGRQNGNYSSVKIIASFVPGQAWKGTGEGKLLTPQGGGIVGDFFPPSFIVGIMLFER